MKRRLFTIFSALSPLPFVAVLVLWAGSYMGETMLIESMEGQILFIGIDGPRGPIGEARKAKTLDRFLDTLKRQGTGAPPAAGPRREHRFLGFSFVSGKAGLVEIRTERGYRTATYAYSIVGVPYWLPASITGGALAWWMVHARRAEKRRRASACAHCGYDMRATPERCPECGAVPAQLPT